MIDAKEIEAKAQEFEIHASNVQKDYVFGWLLFGIFTASDLRNDIFLKGGNALRKGYFENTRFSGDLDFGIPNDIPQETLLAEVNKVCDLIQDRAGVAFVKDDARIEEKFTASDAPLPDLKVYEVRVYFKDFYGNADHLKLRISMDVTRFDKVMLPLQTKKLIHPYSDAAEVECEIRCMKLEEIIATKMKCLMQRQHAPDLFDYAYSIKLVGGNLDKGEVVRTLVRKTIFDRNPFILKGILLKTAFDYFRQEWEKSIVCAKQVFIAVEEAIAMFTADLDTLFADYKDNGYAQFTYFAPEYRAQIMQAGRTQTVLKMRYKGADRIIEPYSLKYLQRRDGVAREYFFGFNRSGGSSPPDMRSFVAENLQTMENTDEVFKPQYPIELSKAGEMPENPYHFDPNKPRRAPRARVERSVRTRTVRSRATSGVQYIYRCSTCGRKFTRSTSASTLREHKNKSGFPCYGYPIYESTKYGW